MNWLTLAVAIAKQYEGCKLVAYPDPASGGAPWTIGYGATGPGTTRGTVWTQEQADADLVARMTNIGTLVDDMVTAILTDNQKAALCDFAYNLGETALRGSTLLRLLNAELYSAAAAQFAVWNKAGGKIMPGLVHRRAAETVLFLS
jgi:lysozyme